MRITKDNDLIITHKGKGYIYYHLLSEWCDGDVPASVESKLNSMVPKIYRLLFEDYV